jgi:CIC family chloride channel protein
VRRLILPDAGRLPRLLVAAMVTGVLTGLLVAGFERITTEIILDELLGWPTWQQAIAPGVGLVLAAVLLRYLAAKASPATSDEFVRVFHDRRARASLRLLPGRMLAGVATIGLGGALGLEGPAIYAGATIGDSIQHRLSRWFSREDMKLLLMAGAAAGVAAVFKTPATGVVFALEAPYRDDVAPRALLPALVASASSYMVFVFLIGTEPIFPGLGVRPSLELSGLVGAVIVGTLAGFGGRAFSWFVHQAKTMAEQVRLRWRLVGASLILGGLVYISQAVFDAPLTLGPGYQAVEWATEPGHSLPLLAWLFLMRMTASIATISGGGVGGLFIPLTVQGILLGRFVGDLVGQPDSSLYPTIGLAAFLGAGYRAPLAAVMFVAESTNGDFFVVPALIAAAMSQLVAGKWSVSLYQRSVRRGHLEQRLELPLATGLSTDVLTVPPDATAAEFVWTHALGNRTRVVPVVDGATYKGMCALEAVLEVDRSEWETTAVGDLVDLELPAARPGWTLGDAMAAMEKADCELLAVVDDGGSFIGTVDAAEILKLEEILDETGG